MDGLRIDKWLWAARLYKHRADATAACQGGHVKVEGESVKPAKAVRIGMRIEALTPGGLRVVEVVALSEVRGPAPVAQKLYNDFSPPPPPKDPWAPLHDTARPDKRDRRASRRLKERW